MTWFRGITHELLTPWISVLRPLSLCGSSILGRGGDFSLILPSSGVVRNKDKVLIQDDRRYFSPSGQPTDSSGFRSNCLGLLISSSSVITASPSVQPFHSPTTRLSCPLFPPFPSSFLNSSNSSLAHPPSLHPKVVHLFCVKTDLIHF